MCDDHIVFEYLYRDAGNYKAWGSLLLRGSVTPECEAELRSYLDSGEFFVAEAVGVPLVNRELWKWSGGPTEDDHGFHEFHGFRRPTEEELREPVWGAVEELVGLFRKSQDSHLFTNLL